MDALSVTEQKRVLNDRIHRAIQAFEAVTGDNVTEISVNRLSVDGLDRSKDRNICTGVTVNFKER